MPYADPIQPALPYQSGSETSRQAAIEMESHADTQRARYFQWLLSKGEAGGTDIEAADELGIKRQSLCPRRMELRARNLIFNSGRRRNSCTVWTA